MAAEMILVSIECHGTKHFYSMVRVLNQQIGRGRWTTRGRIIRKLRRLDTFNHLVRSYQHQPDQQSMYIQLIVPHEHANISTALQLWSEHGQR